MDIMAYNIFVFSSFFIGGSGEWIEITQASDNLPEKSPSLTKQYAFPRNEYVYTQPPNNNQEFLQSPYPSTTTAATPLEKIVESTIEDTFSNNKTSPPYSIDALAIQNRMDESDDINVEKLVRITEEPNEETTETWASVETKEETENFIPFLKKVQDEIIVKSHKNLKGKISMLKNLRDDLLLNIDERISNLWGGKSKGGTEAARGHKEDDHDMHFPSNEGALMTIGFLTFAVFLIKLVLKLVQALKEKHNMVMVTPTMITTNAAFIGRRKRDAVYDEQNRILQLIDEYSFT